MRKTLAALCGFFIACGIAQAQSGIGTLTAAGADCTTVGACVSVNFSSTDNGSASIQLSGTFNATVQFEASSDNGTTWVAISGTPLNSTTAVTSATTANTWKFNVASLTSIRARCSIFTSAPTVVIHTSKAVANAIGGGGAVYASGNGTNNVIPKGNGANQLADSSITDNGTTISSAEPYLTTALGTTSANSIQVGQANTGLSAIAGLGGISVVRNGAETVRFNGSVDAISVLGSIGFATGGAMATSNDAMITRKGAGNIRFGGTDVNSGAVAQTISVQNNITGSDLAGTALIIDAPLGTGAGAGASTKLNRAQILATGTTAQTGANAFVVCETKILSNTSATTTTIATIGLASNSGGGVTVFHSLTATDATNFDSETQSYNVSFVNKAGAITVGTPAITTSTAANNSGSATIGATVTGASPTISLKVTPVYGTIVPSTVTLYTTIINHGAGVVTCN
jgi:hypothetical protein